MDNNNNNNNTNKEEEEGETIKSTADQNPNPPSDDVADAQPRQPPPPVVSTRTPFTNLSQVDSDLALARRLQEQERAYMMLRMNGEGSDYESWEAGSFYNEDDEDIDDASSEEIDGEEDDNADDDIDDVEDDDDEDEHEDDDDEDDEEEDAFDVHAHEEAEDVVELDPASFPNDEAYARALQDAEDREMAARLLALAGLNGREDEDMDDHSDNSESQETWDEVDPDELSYEELLALGEVVGTESRGLSASAIASLPSVSYKKQKTQDANNDSCVICRLDYEDDDTLTVLSCKHSYHSECINNWLRINKVCPVCSTEVSTSGNS